MAAGAIVLLAATHFMLLGEGRPFQVLTNFHMVYGYGLPVAMLMFCVARYRSPLAALLERRPLVAAGDVSYSIYLVHLIVIDRLTGSKTAAIASGSALGLWGVTLMMCAVTIAVSFVTYNLIERPARFWLRRVLSETDTVSPASRLLRVSYGVSRASVLSCVVVVPFAMIVLRPPARTSPPSAGVIEIVKATYGANCGASAGNASRHLADECSGSTDCSYVVDVNQLGDPASGCAKDFEALWRCPPQGEVHTARLEGEAGLGGKSVLLSCPMMSAASMN
jgi:hypothetical protein